jgi:hypothetical protein
MAPALSRPAKVNSQAASTLGSIIISRNSPGNYEFFKTQPEQRTHTDAERTEPERTTNARRLAAFCLRGFQFPFGSVDFAAGLNAWNSCCPSFPECGLRVLIFRR